MLALLPSLLSANDKLNLTHDDPSDLLFPALTLT